MMTRIYEAKSKTDSKYLIVENVIQIKSGIITNVDASVKEQ